MIPENRSFFCLCPLNQFSSLIGTVKMKRAGEVLVETGTVKAPKTKDVKGSGGARATAKSGKEAPVATKKESVTGAGAGVVESVVLTPLIKDYGASVRWTVPCVYHCVHTFCLHLTHLHPVPCLALFLLQPSNRPLSYPITTHHHEHT
jgi:hypothetical protein